MKDKLTREYINAVKIIDCKNCDNPEILLENKYNQAVISKIPGCVGRKGGYILVDFGRELHGGINLTVHHTTNEENGRVRVVFGESISEALSTLGEKNATNNHSLRDITVEVPFLSRYFLGVEVLAPGCRKVRISPMLDSLNWVRGKYPTPYGEIEIEHKRDGGEIVTTVKAPKEVEIVK